MYTQGWKSGDGIGKNIPWIQSHWVPAFAGMTTIGWLAQEWRLDVGCG
jgi:hypothetical protein